MPGEDGYGLMRRRPRPCRPTGRARRRPRPSPPTRGTEDRVKALRAGFQIHLAKPVQPAELATAVLRLSGRKG